MKRALIFLAITFGITYAYEFLVVYPLAAGTAPYISDLVSPTLAYMGAVALVMLFPALGVVLTRVVTREGFKNCVLKPTPPRQSLPWFAVAWFGPILLVLAGGAVYYLLFPGDFDPALTSFVEAQRAAAVANGADPATLAAFNEAAAAPLAMVVSLLGACAIAPALNIVTTFGEEWGWRGYLMPKLATRLSIVPTLVVTGVIWGLWHAPIVALGHNYGTGYPTEPWGGILAMCAWCVALAVFLGYVTIRTRSTFAAAIGHGALNGSVNLVTICSISGGSPFVGPLCTGIVGGLPLLAVAALMLWDLRRREKAGALHVPEAGLPDGVQKEHR